MKTARIHKREAMIVLIEMPRFVEDGENHVAKKSPGKTGSNITTAPINTVGTALGHMPHSLAITKSLLAVVRKHT